MPFPQRSRSAVPLDQQSVLPSVRGLPWWGAVLVAAGVTAVGAAIDANANDTLGAVFNFCYLLGCVVAALAVRRRALFTAAAQPPLIAFGVGMITLYGLNADEASGLKSLVFKVLLPIANDFPWMALTFVVTLLLVLARWFMTRDKGDAPTERPRGGGSRPSARSKAATGDDARPDTSAPDRERKPRPARSDDAAVARAESADSRTGGTRRRDTRRRDTQRSEMPRREAQRRDAQQPDPQRGEIQRRENQRGETRRRDAQRREAAGAAATSSTATASPGTRSRSTAGEVQRRRAGEELGDPADAVTTTIPAARAVRESAPAADRPSATRAARRPVSAAADLATYESAAREGTASASYPSTRSRNQR
ncbi:DUF6542 domain-containing protein [Gordonia sp. NPDC003425]